MPVAAAIGDRTGVWTGIGASHCHASGRDCNQGRSNMAVKFDIHTDKGGEFVVLVEGRKR
jgi:hypothetical protein